MFLPAPGRRGWSIMSSVLNKLRAIGALSQRYTGLNPSERQQNTLRGIPYIGQLRSFFVRPTLVYAVLYIQMRVSWDEAKSRSNQRKHGIGFDTASQVFLDPLHLSQQDRIVEGEERWQTIGMVNGVLLILVAYTVVDEKEEVLRIISARRVTRQERIEYEEASQI
jgi:uncharacterized DUF497 family protein